MIRRRVGEKIAVGYKTALKKKFAVLQIAAEVGGGQVERVSEKAGVGQRAKLRSDKLERTRPLDAAQPRLPLERLAASRHVSWP